MKITLSQSQWNEIGKKAGWFGTNFPPIPKITLDMSSGKSIVWDFVRDNKRTPSLEEVIAIIKDPQSGFDLKNVDDGYIQNVAHGGINVYEYVNNVKTAQATTFPPEVVVSRQHAIEKHKLLAAISLAIPCLEDWTKQTGHGETYQRDLKALNAMKDAVKTIDPQGYLKDAPFED